MGYEVISDSDFDVLPQGDYDAIVENIDKIKYANNEKHIMTHSSQPEDDDDMLEITFQILHPDFNGRKQYLKLKLWDLKEKTVLRAKRMFKQLAEACDKNPQMVRREELYNIPLIIKIGHFKPDEQKTYPFVSKILKKSSATIDATLPVTPKKMDDDIPF